MIDEDDPPIAIPEWVVTFGNLMSLLLTFFIMLVSLSEMKSEEKYVLFDPGASIEDSRLFMNARAEVFLLNEMASESQGTHEEREQMLLKNSKAERKDVER